MWRGIVDIWTLGNDSERIDARMAPIVMLFDVFHVDRTAHAGYLENIFGVIKQIWIFTK